MTTGGSGFSVSPEELRSFAKGLADRGGKVDAVAAEAAGIALGPEAFGQIMGHFSNDADQKAEEMKGNIKELAAAIDRAVEDVKASADDYDRIDDANSENFNGLRGQS